MATRVGINTWVTVRWLAVAEIVGSSSVCDRVHHRRCSATGLLADPRCYQRTRSRRRDRRFRVACRRALDSGLIASLAHVHDDHQLAAYAGAVPRPAPGGACAGEGPGRGNYEKGSADDRPPGAEAGVRGAPGGPRS